MSTIIARGLLTFEFKRDDTVDFFLIAIQDSAEEEPIDYRQCVPAWEDQTRRACIHLDEHEFRVPNGKIQYIFVKIQYFNGQITIPAICTAVFSELELPAPADPRVINDSN